MTESSFHFSENDGVCLLTIQCPTGDLPRLMDIVRDKLLTPILEERQHPQASESENQAVSTVPNDVSVFYTTTDTVVTSCPSPMTTL